MSAALNVADSAEVICIRVSLRSGVRRLAAAFVRGRLLPRWRGDTDGKSVVIRERNQGSAQQSGGKPPHSTCQAEAGSAYCLLLHFTEKRRLRSGHLFLKSRKYEVRKATGEMGEATGYSQPGAAVPHLCRACGRNQGSAGQSGGKPPHSTCGKRQGASSRTPHHKQSGRGILLAPAHST